MILSLGVALAMLRPPLPPEERYESFSATITAYSELETCSNNSCITASGTVASLNTAACPRKYEFGTQIDVNGVRYICEDRTHIRYDGRFDIFTGYGQRGYDLAIHHGKQTGVVIIID